MTICLVLYSTAEVAMVDSQVLSCTRVTASTAAMALRQARIDVLPRFSVRAGNRPAVLVRPPLSPREP